MHQFIERHCQIKKSSFCKLLHILLLKPGLHESNPLESAICVISYKRYGTPTNSQLLPQINTTLSVGHCTRASEEGFALLCQVLDFHWEQPQLHGADRHSWPCPFPPTSTLTVLPRHLVWPSLGEAVTHTKPWIMAKNNLSRKGGGLYGTDAEGGRVVQLGRAEGKTTEHFGSTAHFSANQMQGSSCCTRGLCTSCKTPPLFASGAEQQFCPFNLTNK